MRGVFLHRRSASRTIGYVAGYCRIERNITCHRVREVRRAWYLNFIRLTRGDFLQKDSCCTSCGLENLNDVSDYASVAKKPLPLEDLLRTTNPSLTSTYSEELELGDKLRRREALDQATRMRLVLDQFDLIETSYRATVSGETKLDRVAGWSAIFSFPLWIIVMNLLGRFMPAERNIDALMYGMIFGFALLVANAFLFFTGPKRELKRKLYPLVKHALAPLDLTRMELAELLDRAKRNGATFPSALGEKSLLQLVRQS